MRNLERTAAALALLLALPASAEKPVRGVVADCDPAERAATFESFVGKRGNAFFEWENVEPEIERTPLPIAVISVSDGIIEAELSKTDTGSKRMTLVLKVTGHIRPLEEKAGHTHEGFLYQFAIEPCSLRQIDPL